MKNVPYQHWIIQMEHVQKKILIWEVTEMFGLRFCDFMFSVEFKLWKLKNEVILKQVVPK